MLEEFREIESGKKDDRPQLTAALAACRRHRAVLVIAKLDRLARRVSFISTLMDGDVDFVACDFPQANRLTVHILAAVAEHEHRLISERTRAALAAAKARGVKLGGNPASLRNREGGWTRSAQVRRERAARRAADLHPVIEAVRSGGAASYAATAAGLNARGVPAPRGGRWHPNTVRQVLRRGEHR